MGCRVGFDLGTTFSKVAHIGADGELRQFRFPGGQAGDEYIPTAVAYQEDPAGESVLIGKAAHLSFFNRGGKLFDRFKMLLPHPAEIWKERGWPDVNRMPNQVTQDYLRQLLIEDSDGFVKAAGKIDSMVVSVPEFWQQRYRENYGAADLLHILREELKLPVDRLQSEPVCAAAFYGWRFWRTSPQKDRPFNLLVCDIGGGSFDVALCRVAGGTITVLDFDGDEDHAGVCFDQQAVRQALQREGKSEADLEPAEFRQLLDAFESEKVGQSGPARRIMEITQNIPEAGDRTVYSISRGKYTWNVVQIREAFEPVGRSIQEVLGRLVKRLRERGERIDEVALAGAPAASWPVENAIRSVLPLPLPYLETRPEERGLAVSRGAALIAAGRVETVEFYPNEIGLEVWLKSGTFKKEILRVVRPGELRAGQLAPVFMRDKNDRRVPVEVKSESTTELPVMIRISGDPKWYAFKTLQKPLPPKGFYHVGLRVDQSNLGELIFRAENARQDGSDDIKYPLGRLTTDLVVEGEV